MAKIAFFDKYTLESKLCSRFFMNENLFRGWQFVLSRSIVNFWTEKRRFLAFVFVKTTFSVVLESGPSIFDLSKLYVFSCRQAITELTNNSAVYTLACVHIWLCLIFWILNYGVGRDHKQRGIHMEYPNFSDKINFYYHDIVKKHLSKKSFSILLKFYF